MPKKGFLEQFAKRQFEQISIDGIPVDEAFILNEAEVKVIKKVRFRAIFLAALLGTLGVLFLYIPQYIFPKLFPETSINVFGLTLNLPLVGWLWAIILVVVEINLLNIVNIQAVARMAAACHWPKKDSENYTNNFNALLGAALEKPATDINNYGINPFFGLPKFSYAAYFIFNKAKATLSNALVKILVSRLLGRVAIRQVTDMAGIPIFAFWNAWATHLVLKEAVLRIMAPDTITNLTNELYGQYKDDLQFKTLLKDALQYIAILKRNYNYAHFLLAKSLFTTFKIEDENYTHYFLQNYTMANANTQAGLLKVIIAGVCIDGKISIREEHQLLQIINENTPYTLAQIKKIAADFKNGKGLKI